jgi:hypothetical protein
MQRGLAGTRERVPAEMLRLPLSTYETVLSETPACWATSAMVTGAGPVSGPGRRDHGRKVRAVTREPASMTR